MPSLSLLVAVWSWGFSRLCECALALSPLLFSVWFGLCIGKWVATFTFLFLEYQRETIVRSTLAALLLLRSSSAVYLSTFLNT